MRNLVLTLFIIVSGCQVLLGQQAPEFEHYLVNPYSYNPAMAGMNQTQVFLDYRKQWADFAGAPQTQLFTIDKSFKKDKFGLGFKLLNDDVNVLGSTGGYLTYAQQFKIGQVQSIRFGVEVGFLQNRILFDRIVAEDNTEPVIFSSNQNGTNFDGAAGFIYRLENFSLGFSALHLIPSRYHFQNSETTNELEYGRINHYYLTAMYDFHIGESKWLIQPSALARSVQGMPFIFEGSLTTKYDDLGWLTLRYRHKSGYSVGAGGVIADQVTIGYAYGFSSNDLVNYNVGTHELILGLKLSGNKGGGDGNISNKKLEQLEQQNNELFEKTDYLEKQNEALREELERQKEELKNKVFGLDQLKLELEKELEEWKNSNGGVGSNTNTDSNSAAESELGHATLKEDGEKYVVIGATRSLASAKKYQTIISREYDESTSIVQNEKQTWYLIYTLKTESVDEAQKELKRVKKLNTKNIYVGKPWIYE